MSSLEQTSPASHVPSTPLAPLPAPDRSRRVTAIIEIGHTLDADWGKGAEAEGSLIDASGVTVASSHFSMLPASLSARWAVGPRALPPSDYELRVRAKAASPGSTATDSLRVTVAATVDGAGFLLFKRGPGTGNREIATADLRFRGSRSESCPDREGGWVPRRGDGALVAGLLSPRYGELDSL